MTFSFIRRPGFIAGIIAALLATVIMIWLGNRYLAPIAPQLLSDRITEVMPLELFSSVMGVLESGAKPLVFLLIVAGQLLLGGIIGGILDPYIKNGMSRLLVLLATVAGAWALLGLVISPIGGTGLFGSSSSTGLETTAFVFLAAAVVFGGALTLGLSLGAGDFDVPYDPGRRRVIAVLSLGVPAAIGSVYMGHFYNELSARSQLSDPDGTLPPALTPTEDFYIVSKNFNDPSVPLNGWNLPVEGVVDGPQTYGYDDLRAMPVTEQITTLECVSNEVGGQYISNAKWTGVALREVLEDVGIGDGAVDVVLRAADDYSDSIPIEIAMDPRVVLAYDMNDAELEDGHGYPLRLIVPGIYGMKHVKWITGIEVVDYDYKGYWQERSWSDVATIYTMSRIDSPNSGQRIPVNETVTVGGVAFSGTRGISRVTVSLDDGETWNDAVLEDPLSEMSWVRWTYAWTPGEAQHTGIVARAYDGDGTPQTEEEQQPLPEGSTGLHRIQVTVLPPEQS